jgi:hypothetical protein
MAVEVVGGRAADLARTGEGGGPIGARRDCRRDCIPVGMSWDALEPWFPDDASSFSWKWIHEVRGVETRPAPPLETLPDFCRSDLFRSCSKAFSAALARLARWVAEMGATVTEAAAILLAESCEVVGSPGVLRGLVGWRAAEIEGERPLLTAGLGE